MCRKTEGGHKRGHSNMTHWKPTAVVKQAARVKRRQEDRLVNEKKRDYSIPRLRDADFF